MTILFAATCLLALGESGLRPSSEPIPKLASYVHPFVIGYSKPDPYAHYGGATVSFCVNDPGPIQVSIDGAAIVFPDELKPEFKTVPNVKVPLKFELSAYPVNGSPVSYQTWQAQGPIARLMYIVPKQALWSGFDMDEKKSYNRWALQIWQEKTPRMGMKGTIRITAPYPRFQANEMPTTILPTYKEASHWLDVPAKMPGRYVVTGKFEVKPSTTDPTKPAVNLPALMPPVDSKLEIVPGNGKPPIATASGKSPQLVVRAYPDFANSPGRFGVRLTTTSKLRPLRGVIRAEWVPDRPESSVSGKFVKG